VTDRLLTLASSVHGMLEQLISDLNELDSTYEGYTTPTDDEAKTYLLGVMNKLETAIVNFLTGSGRIANVTDPSVCLSESAVVQVQGMLAALQSNTDSYLLIDNPTSADGMNYLQAQRTVLQSTLVKSIQQVFMVDDTTNDLWDRLKDLYAQAASFLSGLKL